MNTFDATEAEKSVKGLLNAIGEDASRDGLRDTPKRVAKAWQEMLAGYQQDPGKVLLTSSGTNGFSDTGYDQMIVLARYPLTSVCEHHMLPFLGHADVGYMPAENGTVVGLSKLGRLVDAFSQRLQIQERLTQQVAFTLSDVLSPRGVGVRIQSVHQCMTCRGVRKGGVMVTESLLGNFQEHAVRDEFWHLSGASG